MLSQQFSPTFLKVIKPPNDFSFDTYIYWLALKITIKLLGNNFVPPRVYGESKWNIN